MRNTTLCHIEKDGKYLMLHRVKKQADMNKDKWVGIGGKFEDKESPEECNKREVFEETGLTVNSAEYRGIVTFVSDVFETEYMHIFTCSDFSGDIIDCDEGELSWIDKNDLLSLPIWEGDKIFLKLIADASLPFFSLKLEYIGQKLHKAVLNGKIIVWEKKFMNICVYGASSNTIDKSYINANFKLGKLLAVQNHTVVYGGGAGGMMGAVARGARENGGDVIGISPSFFKVDGSLYDNCTEFIYTETMRQRKQLLEDKSDGFIISPGGIGTLDEFFEIFTLRQLCRHQKPIVIFNVNNYYDYLIKFLDVCIEQNFMSSLNKELYFVTDDSQAAIDYIVNYIPKKTKLSDLKDVK